MNSGTDVSETRVLRCIIQCMKVRSGANFLAYAGKTELWPNMAEALSVQRPLSSSHLLPFALNKVLIV